MFETICAGLGFIFLLALFFFILLFAIDCFESDLIVGGAVSSFFSLLCLVGSIYCGYHFLNPAETIEVNGYTYTLYEEPPQEVIEFNGQKYILEESENA